MTEKLTMPAAFSVGAICRLKSGGPLMTVSDVHAGIDAGDVICALYDVSWFDGAVLSTGTFFELELLAAGEG